MLELDPRWDWLETTPFGSAQPEYLKGHCRHLATEVVDIVSVTGETVARLCQTCDAQLPPLDT